MQRARRAQMPGRKPQSRALESQNWRPGPATVATTVKSSAAPSWHNTRSLEISSPDTVQHNGQPSSILGKRPVFIAGTRLFVQMTEGSPLLVPECEMAEHILKAKKIALAKERAQRIKKRQDSDASRKPIDTLYIGNLPAIPFTEEHTREFRAQMNASYEKLLTTELHECFATQPGFRRSYVKSHDGTPQALVQFNTIEDAVRAKDNLDGRYLTFLKEGGRRCGLRLSFARNPILVGTSYKQAPIGIWEARAESKRQAQLEVQQSAVPTAAFGLLGKASLLQHSSQQPKKLSAAAAAFAPEQPLFMVPVKKSHAVEIRADPKKSKDYISPQKSVQHQAATPDRQSPVDSLLSASDVEKILSRANSNSSSTSEAISSSSALTEDQPMTVRTMSCRNCPEQMEFNFFTTLCRKCESFKTTKPRFFNQEEAAEFPGAVEFEANYNRSLQETSETDSSQSSEALEATTLAEEDNLLPCLNCKWPRENADLSLCEVCDRYRVTASRISEGERMAWEQHLRKRREAASKFDFFRLGVAI